MSNKDYTQIQPVSEENDLSAKERIQFRNHFKYTQFHHDDLPEDVNKRFEQHSESHKKDFYDMLTEMPEKFALFKDIVKDVAKSDTKFDVSFEGDRCDQPENAFMTHVFTDYYNVDREYSQDVCGEKCFVQDSRAIMGEGGLWAYLNASTQKALERKRISEATSHSDVVKLCEAIYNLAEGSAIKSLIGSAQRIRRLIGHDKERTDWEYKLYQRFLQTKKTPLEAQKQFIGAYIGQYMNPDKKLAYIGLHRYFDKDMSVSAYLDSPELFEKHSPLGVSMDKFEQGFDYDESMNKNYYMKKLAKEFKNAEPTKQLTENDYKIIDMYEKDFKERYGVNMSLMSAVSTEFLQQYGLSKQLLLPATKENIYDRKKWRPMEITYAFRTQHFMALDLARYPFDMNKVKDVLSQDGLEGSKDYMLHSNGSVSQALLIHEKNYETDRPQLDLLEKMFQKYENMPPRELTAEEVSKTEKAIKGTSFTFDSKNPPVLYLGSKDNILPLKYVLTADMKKYLEKGMVLYIGRDVDDQPIRPSEVDDRPYKKYDCPDVDLKASRLHGYITAEEDGKLRYTDCSANGTFVKCIENKNDMVDAMAQTIRHVR